MGIAQLQGLGQDRCATDPVIIMWGNKSGVRSQLAREESMSLASSNITMARSSIGLAVSDKLLWRFSTSDQLYHKHARWPIPQAIQFPLVYTAISQLGKPWRAYRWSIEELTGDGRAGKPSCLSSALPSRGSSDTCPRLASHHESDELRAAPTQSCINTPDKNTSRSSHLFAPSEPNCAPSCQGLLASTHSSFPNPCPEAGPNPTSVAPL
ncbi:hypothetical protein PGT21_020663 [Puccinia graminis f. sp. tritici]|uniref:Uncharacterized protein n=1 Tax=Puccinia graminis f. sp. tritici TaxID=56615 RepID=A0A5B0P5J9_PUCGR|nr:hypothetical protein PGTUg99_032114 [Puccinia graminis f. sp. tritici]KAA1099793.1 hypothetical protein PGT21_020663 [Puccinia graminis f. sp. tritici]